MNPSPQFSIVTASYNQGRFIRDCIESVKNQTGVTWEHIIQDAGSTDETLAVLEEYPHLKVTCEKDAGMSDGINRGFLKATGNWVMWLNTDDYLLPGALAQVAACATRHPEADVIYGGWNFVTTDKRLIKTAAALPYDLGMLTHYGCYIGSTACFFRRQTTVAQGLLLDTGFRQAMDQEYYVRLGKAGKRFRPLPEILAGFRIHGENTSMRHTTARDMAGILARQRQLSEGAAIRRAYGITFFRNDMATGILDAMLWFWFRTKNLLYKLFIRVRRGRGISPA
jgi:glycosyltransferase involved in cell wall biosynthesis